MINCTSKTGRNFLADQLVKRVVEWFPKKNSVTFEAFNFITDIKQTLVHQRQKTVKTKVKKGKKRPCEGGKK